MATRLTGNPDRWTAVFDGQRLRELRHQRALSQVELAKLAGVSAHTVSKLEGQPASCCRSRTLARLAAALGESPGTIAASMAQRSDWHGGIRRPVRIFFTVIKGAPAARQPSGPMGRIARSSAKPPGKT